MAYLIDYMRERCEISAAVAMLLCIAWVFIGPHRLFHLLRVVPVCFSEVKLEIVESSASVYLFKIFKIIVKFCKLLIMWWQ